MQQSRVEQGAEYIRTQTAMLGEKKHITTQKFFSTAGKLFTQDFRKTLASIRQKLLGGGVPLTPKYPR